MKVMTSVLLAGLLTVLAGCTTSSTPTPLLSAEPAIDAELNRAPRTLRLFYNALPDVSRSSLRLVGPAGNELALRGLHTMAADDLMIEIMDPVQPGTYTVYWTTVVGDDPTVYDGSFQFSYSQ